MKTYLFLLFISSLILCPSHSARASQEEVGFRIVGGEVVSPGEINFIVSLQDNSGHFCGGSMIHPQWVLTAAHCVVGFRQPDTIVSGSIDLRDNENLHRFPVEKIVVHPNYSSQNISYDFALIKITGTSPLPLIEVNRTKVSGLPTNHFTVAGWGYTYEGENQVQDILRQVEVPFVDQQTCEEQFQTIFPQQTDHLDESMFCAGYTEGMRDACGGDSGGPIFYWNEELQDHILIGVVSWGYGCARESLSGVYGDISIVMDWVDGEAFTDSLLAGL